MARPSTLGELRSSSWKSRSVKDEIRENLVVALREERELFPGIVGYDRTVIPQIVNALLSRHDLILLGLRGQAKSRILRHLSAFLDDEIPVIAGSPLNDDPFRPVTVPAQRLVAEHGDATPIEWMPRERRFEEKLATPDVTMADLIGDIDPIKAATERRNYADPEIIHFGIIPRMNRGIFAINELPDLQPRIQVGLLNLMQEKDIQIRGFPIRLPLDVLMVYSANPEDYTNRGNIITPLKDRIGSQIVTHYPRTLAEAVTITGQEAWTERSSGVTVVIPDLFREIIEETAIQARESEFVDQSSGVSVRLTITLLENLVSNLERRGLATGDTKVYPRLVDLRAALSAVTGKIELVYEGEQEGAETVARHVLGKAVRDVFLGLFPEVHTRGKRRPPRDVLEELTDPEPPARERSATTNTAIYQPIVQWFSSGNSLDLSDDTPFAEHLASLRLVTGLEECVRTHVQVETEGELAGVMELVLDGLHQCSLLAKEDEDAGVGYRDMIGAMFQQMEGIE
ncbi:MAG: magnesium chelatase [Gemmatimonadota bacterium]|nr:MAG: magnesium chelatase [Gemmatimonadota bacterium]